MNNQELLEFIKKNQTTGNEEDKKDDIKKRESFYMRKFQ